MENKNLRIVVLDYPYEIIQNADVQSLFAKVMALKIQGYQKEYPYGVLPVDTTDFIATHMLVCNSENGVLTPLMGLKSVLLERSKVHSIEFPAITLMKKSNVPDQTQIVEKMVSDLEQNKQKVAYNSSWTVHPEVRKNKELKNLIVDLSYYLLVRYYLAYSIPNVFAAATLRFHVHTKKEFIGFEYLKKKDGNNASSFPCLPFFGEEVAMMYLRKPAKDALEWAKQFDHYWNNRITFDSLSLGIQKPGTQIGIQEEKKAA